MTLESSRELIAIHSDPGSSHDLGQGAIDSLIREYDLEKLWELNPCTKIESALMS